MFTPSRLLMIRFPQILVQVGVKGLARVTMLTTFCLSLALTVSHVVEHFVRLEPTMMVGYDYFKTLTPRLYDQKAIVDKANNILMYSTQQRGRVRRRVRSILSLVSRGRNNKMMTSNQRINHIRYHISVERKGQ